MVIVAFCGIPNCSNFEGRSKESKKKMTNRKLVCDPILTKGFFEGVPGQSTLESTYRITILRTGFQSDFVAGTWDHKLTSCSTNKPIGFSSENQLNIRTIQDYES